MCGISHASESFAGVHGSPEYQFEDTPRFIVQYFFRNLPFPQQFQIRICQIVVVEWMCAFGGKTVGERSHFDIQPVVGGFERIVSTAPIGHYNAVEVPVSFQYFVQHPVVVAGVLSVDLVVCAHYGPRASFFYGSLESRQVYFIEGAFAAFHIYVQSPLFLIVQGEMFHAGSNPVLLYAFDIGHCHSGGQVRVFAHVFEIPAVQRRAVYVYARTQNDVFVAVQGFFAQRVSIGVGKFGVPCGGKAAQCRKSRDTVVRPAGIVPVSPVEFCSYSVRSVAPP